MEQVLLYNSLLTSLISIFYSFIPLKPARDANWNHTKEETNGQNCHCFIRCIFSLLFQIESQEEYVQESKSIGDWVDKTTAHAFTNAIV